VGADVGRETKGTSVPVEGGPLWGKKGCNQTHAKHCHEMPHADAADAADVAGVAALLHQAVQPFCRATGGQLNIGKSQAMSWAATLN
jgi:hypothetical protein